MNSKQKTIVITGAGSGIGRALALGFCSDGYRVIGLGRTAGTLRATKALAPAEAFDFRVLDIADDKAVSTLFQDLGSIDVLINNSAVYPRSYFLDQTASDWAQTILVNLCGPANCCRAVLPQMLARNDGRIINVGSLADWWPIASASAYSASKGGLHALTKALAAEIDRERHPNVLINEMIPHATQTSMSEHGATSESLYPLAKRLVEFSSGGPTGRMFNPLREIIANESLKARLKRFVLRR